MAGSPPHVISKFGREIDNLYLMILFITGIVFIGTQIVFVVALLPVCRRARRPRAGPSARPSISTAASGSR